MTQQQNTSTDTYQIYVASLSDYNAGILHGKWIDLDGLSASDIQEEINEILRTSPYAKQYDEVAEEWAIHGATRSRIQRAGRSPPIQPSG